MRIRVQGTRGGRACAMSGTDLRGCLGVGLKAGTGNEEMRNEEMGKKRNEEMEAKKHVFTTNPVIYAKAARRC